MDGPNDSTGWWPRREPCYFTDNGLIWCVPYDATGALARVQVTVRDDIGEVQDIHWYLIETNGTRRRPPQQRD